MRPFAIIRFAALAAVLALLPSLQVARAAAPEIETKAEHAYLLDAQTGAVLLDKNGDAPMAPASMSKLMTVFMVFERLKRGELSLDDTFLVSEKAWRKGGSKMFVKVNTRVKVRDLLRGIIVQSGNDACIVVAEGLAGTEEAFADEMTRRAHEIGLTNSHFHNATGWPDPQQYMSAHDIAHLALRIVRDFPEYYSYFSEKTFTYNDIKQGNRNPLLYNNFGADGLKTGHTESSGYGLAASAKRGGRRLILVVNGLDSVRERGSESARLLDWGFRTFKNYTLFDKGETVGRADVWLGTTPDVAAVIPDGLTVTLPRRARNSLEVKLVQPAPVRAPVTAGDLVATLVVNAPGVDPIEVPLRAAEDVKQLGVVGRLWAAFQQLLWGHSG